MDAVPQAIFTTLACNYEKGAYAKHLAVAVCWFLHMLLLSIAVFF